MIIKCEAETRTNKPEYNCRAYKNCSLAAGKKILCGSIRKTLKVFYFIRSLWYRQKYKITGKAIEWKPYPIKSIFQKIVIRLFLKDQYSPTRGKIRFYHLWLYGVSNES